jgi:predicted tellurium resistance membrane protein TerC
MSWIVRAVVLAVGLWLFTQWQSIAAQGAALFAWLLCAGGAELIVEANRRRERRRSPSPPLAGGRRHTDPPLRG